MRLGPPVRFRNPGPWTPKKENQNGPPFAASNNKNIIRNYKIGGPKWTPVLGLTGGRFQRSRSAKTYPRAGQKFGARHLIFTPCERITVGLNTKEKRFARGNDPSFVDVGSKHCFGNLPMRMLSAPGVRKQSACCAKRL